MIKIEELDIEEMAKLNLVEVTKKLAYKLNEVIVNISAINAWIECRNVRDANTAIEILMRSKI